MLQVRGQRLTGPVGLICISPKCRFHFGFSLERPVCNLQLHFPCTVACRYGEAFQLAHPSEDVGRDVALGGRFEVHRHAGDVHQSQGAPGRSGNEVPAHPELRLFHFSAAQYVGLLSCCSAAPKAHSQSWMGSGRRVNSSNYGEHLVFVAVYIGLPGTGLHLPAPARRVVNREDGAVNGRPAAEMQVEASAVRRRCGHCQVMTVMDASGEGKLTTSGNSRGLYPVQVITGKIRIAGHRGAFYRWQYSTWGSRHSRWFQRWSGRGHGHGLPWGSGVRPRNLAGNPDSPQAVVFVTTIIDVQVDH